MYVISQLYVIYVAVILLFSFADVYVLLFIKSWWGFGCFKAKTFDMFLIKVEPSLLL